MLVRSVRLPEALLERVTRMARAEDRTVSSVLRSIIIRALMREEGGR
jgi:predicted transcriptional regulator